MYIKPLPELYHERLLGRPIKPVSAVDAKRIAAYIARFFPDGVTDNSPVVELPLPAWAPTQPELDRLVEREAMPYINRVLSWLTVTELPTPSHWHCQPGWNVWVGEAWETIEQPPEGCYFVDIETVPVESYQFSEDGDPSPTLWAPVCAIALSQTHCYVWVVDIELGLEQLDLLYPGVDGISIGHSIGYDQSYSLREHLSHFEDWSARPMAVDTFSLWQVTRGHCNQQRALVGNSGGYQPMWTDETTGASLADIYEYYFGEELDKGVREFIVEEGWEWVKTHISEVLHYCYTDVVACAQVYQALMPEWIEQNTYQGKTQWLTLWSMMLLSQSWAPIDPSLHPTYFANAEREYQSLKASLSQDLVTTAKGLLELFKPVVTIVTEQQEGLLGTNWQASTHYQTVVDGWVLAVAGDRGEQLRTQLDWTPAKSGKNKGLPKWYRDVLKNPSISTKMAPIILGFTWKGELIHYSETEGYHTATERVDNPDKRGKKVSSLLMKGFKDDARLGAIDGSAEAVLKKVHSMLNWVSLRKRVASMHSFDLEGFPVFKDQLRPWGTVTRRSVSSITQVLPKMDKTGCVGANVRALFTPPPGYRFVIVDFDSQELLLAAEIGDAILDGGGRPAHRGSNPFSVACHIGEKANRTTPHYLLADSANIDYTLAKNVNYGVIYGLGETGITDYFLKANKSMSQSEALERSRATLASQKGTRDRHTKQYLNGSASPTFNNLQRLVNSPDPRSLLSHQRMSKALSQAKGDYVTTKQNWYIQEAGSSMRDRLVLYSWYLMEVYGIVGRLVMTVHDEAVYCVREDQQHLMAYILQLAHLYIVAWKTIELGLDCLPAGQSYFSSVEVDTRWRKSPKANPPSTPDMPNTVWEPGYSLTPHQLVSLIQPDWLV